VSSNAVEQTVPAFRTGDTVQVVNYSHANDAHRWDRKVGVVVWEDWGLGITTIRVEGLGEGGFRSEHLEHFEVYQPGDLIEVFGWTSDTWNGPAVVDPMQAGDLRHGPYVYITHPIQGTGALPRRCIRRRYQPGYVFSSVEDFNQMPVGTIIRVNPARSDRLNEDMQWRKQDQDTFLVHDQARGTYPVGHVVARHLFSDPTFYAVTEQADTRPEPRWVVGTRVGDDLSTPRHFASVPVGGVVANNYGRGGAHWTHVGDGYYRSAGRLLLQDFANEHFRVVEIPDTEKEWFSWGGRSTWYRLVERDGDYWITDKKWTESDGFGVPRGRRWDMSDRTPVLGHAGSDILPAALNEALSSVRAPNRERVSLDDLDVRALWNEEHSGYYVHYNAFARFLDGLREQVTEPERVDEEVKQCSQCSAAHHVDESNVWSGGDVCDRCYNGFSECYGCNQHFPCLTYTADGENICDECRDESYFYCDECDEWQQNDQRENHRHGPCGTPECESPQQEFFIRNDGDPMLRNDTRVTVRLPAGQISPEGMLEIRQMLRDEYYNDNEEDYTKRQAWRLLSMQVEDKVGPVWQTRNGNFTKRLSRFAYQEHGIKIPSTLVSSIGNVARDHSTAVDHAIETTRDLNMGPEAFCHEESCFWGSYSESRCILKTNGGFGLRTFTDDPDAWNSDAPVGRAWVMPLKVNPDEPVRTGLTPTFETQTPDALIVFNGYGNLSGYVPARIMAHMYGWTYRKIGFECSPMYVNGDSAYLIAPEEIAGNYTDGHLVIRTNTHATLFDTEKEDLSHVA
jgi:hypothetical protein